MRAIDREACSTCSANGHSQYYDVIEGFPAANRLPERSHEPSSVAVIRALGPLTLQIHLTQPAGDLPFRFAMAATAPIPPLPNDPKAILGIATGHDQNDGRFSLVGTGPYMIQGTDKLDFSVPPAKQEPVAGVAARQWVFVRNPSWHQSTDPLRHQNVKEMDFTIGGTEEDAAHQVDTGTEDLCMDCPPIPGQVSRYEASPSLRDRVQVHPADALRYLPLNLAQPPFDDVHVRKAINYALDKEQMLRLGEEEVVPGLVDASLATHILPDSLENNELLHYDPYATPGERGSIKLAKEEMAKSKYD